jgi:hypothetical protein
MTNDPVVGRMAGGSFLIASLLILRTAMAMPPSPGSEDARLLEPYKDWIATRHDRYQNPCCDISDGRPVDADMVTIVDADSVRRTHWRAHVTPGHFPGQPDHWMIIPDEKIIVGTNPTGSPILWLYNGLVQCFAPPAGL